MTLRWGSGLGKTYLIGASFAYDITQLRLQTSVMFPNVTLAEDWVRDELFPQIYDRCPEWEELPFRVNLVRKKEWTNGANLQIIGANSWGLIRRVQSSKMYSDEVDAITQEATDEGDKLRAHEARGRGRKIQFKIRSSYPSLEGHSKIDSLMEESDLCRWISTCVNCDHPYEMDTDQIRWPKGQPEKAIMVCPKCDTSLTDQDRREMTFHRSRWIDKRGNVIEGRDVVEGFDGHRGYHLNCMAFSGDHNQARASYLHELAADMESIERAADPERARRVFENTKRCRSYRPKDTPRPRPSELEEYLEDYDPEKALPEDVLGLWSGVDVQKRWLDLSIWGFGENEEKWLVNRIQIPGAYNSPRTWEKLWPEVRKAYPHPKYGPMSCIKRGCAANGYVDGNHWFDEIWRFVKPMRIQGVFLIHSVKTVDAKITAKAPEIHGPTKCVIHKVGVNAAKSTLYEGLTVKEGRGKVHLPRRIADAEYLDELTAENAIEVVLGTEQYWQFENTYQKRNEALDGAVYALAAKTASRPDFKKLRENLEKKAELAKK